MSNQESNIKEKAGLAGGIIASKNASQEKSAYSVLEVQEQIAGRVAALEEKLNDQELAIRELRANHGSKNDSNAVVARMKEEFGKLEHVIQVHYDILGDGTWHIRSHS